MMASKLLRSATKAAPLLTTRLEDPDNLVVPRLAATEVAEVASVVVAAAQDQGKKEALVLQALVTSSKNEHAALRFCEEN